MSRSATPLLLALTLVTGMLVGVLLDRQTATLSAQERSAPPSSSGSAARPAVTSVPRGVGEDAVYEQLARQYGKYEVIDRTFEMVAKAVSPAVVHIVAIKNRQPADSLKVKHYEESGSGVIVRAESGKGVYVVTNNHVVEGAKPAKISVYLQDGRAIHPERVWLDSMADIAVLDLNRDDLVAARFGDSEAMSVGNWVLALGSPFGLTHSVSQGIISARGRHMVELEEVTNQDFLQTDAAINPGNSGGPLINMKGEVIGINNSIASNGGGNEGVGFSIPSNLTRWIMNELIKKGRVTRGGVGIEFRPEFRAEDAARLGLDRPRGAWVSQVYPSSPAAAAGLRDGDVVVRFQYTDVIDLNHLINMISMAPIGQSAPLIVWRDKQRLTLNVTIADRERTVAPIAAELAANDRAARAGVLRRPTRPAIDKGAAMGVHLETMDEATARRLSLPTSLRGAVVVKVEPNSPLASLLQPLDVIHSVNGKAVGSAADAVKALSANPGRDELQVDYDRVVKGTIERQSARFQ